jgi:hypothetical protein
MRAVGAYRHRRSSWRSPGSRARSVRACQVLRPRRVARALAMAHADVLPSATQTASAPGTSFLSRLNGWPARTPADASPTPSRMPAHGSGADVVRYSFIAGDFHPLLLAGLPAHLCENVRPFRFRGSSHPSTHEDNRIQRVLRGRYFAGLLYNEFSHGLDPHRPDELAESCYGCMQRV